MPGQKLVVAVSGGPDSMALLHALHSLRQELRLTLHGAHLDHQLRGEASQQDAEFVARTFLELGIESTIESGDVTGFQKANRLSLEEAAREVRYAFLANVSKQQEAAAIALGHTSNDQAESVLMHLIRGSGLTGLQGMRTVSKRNVGEEHAVLLRPLLNVSREETEAYCEVLNLSPRRDETNNHSNLTRNRVRTDLLPVLESYNPAIKQGLVRLARNASLDMDYMQQQISAVWNRVCTAKGGGMTIDLGVFQELHPALQRHLLRNAVFRVKGDLEDVEQNHVEDMVTLASGPVGKSLDLPGGVKFTVGYHEASLSKGGPALPPVHTFEGCHQILIPGETFVPGWKVGVGFSSAQEVVAQSDNAALLSSEALGDRVWVRSRRPGDRFQPLGMAHQKKLQDFMVDCKIPREQRDGVPLLMTPKGIAWVVGWRIAEWAKVGREEDSKLLVKFTLGD